MALTPGSRLGPYEILSPLGAGGMGEVYRARDERLKREVAVKVLPASFSADPDRLHRFEKEARSASALNHPNIVTIHDIGQEGNVSYIAMELVAGTTLRDLLADGPLPTRKLLGIGAQTAEGLARAHEAGIVHRDLKPENLMIARDGFVKILDFGLAKLTGPPEGSGAVTEAPTVSVGTEPGMVMGTVAYMSPEQAAGGVVDFRSDQFSLGSILYEMAAGKKPFGGATRPEVMAAIIRQEPESLALVAPGTPAAARWIFERCLAKDPSERYASTRDLARDLASMRDHLSELSGGEAISASARRRKRGLLKWGLAVSALLVGLLAGFLIRGRTGVAPGAAPLMRLNMAFSPEELLVLGESISPISLVMSPDGSRLVYTGRHPSGRALYVRSLDQLDAKLIPGTEGAVNPFFSPDGEWVGFGTDRSLKKVSLSGGKPLTLCEMPIRRGASWGADGTILFSPSGDTTLFRVSERGGEPRPLTILSPEKGEMTHRWPHFLPGSKMALFTINDQSGDFDKAKIGVVSTETGQKRVLLEGGSDARYLPAGYLIYLRAATLFAARFDAKRLEVTGPAVPVLDGVWALRGVGYAFYTFSQTGSLIYMPLDPRALEKELVWMDRKGGASLMSDVRRNYREVRFSPDGRRLAVVWGEPGVQMGILTYDLARNSWEQLVSGGQSWGPVWSPDGKRIVFTSNQSGTVNLFGVPSDRSAPPEQLTKVDTWPKALSWFPDGRRLLITDSPSSQSRLAELSFEGDRKLHPLSVASPLTEYGRLSPDGKWIAYDSSESGRFEAYVSPYPGPGGRLQISSDGGSRPVWSPDGREIFFYSGRKLMVVAIETHPELRAGASRTLFEAQFENFDISPDGQHFVVTRPAHTDLPPQPLAVVLGWSGDIERRLKARN